MKRVHTNHGFSIVQLLVVLAIVTVATALVLPALAASRRAARHKTSNTQLRGIHVAMVTYSQSSKKGGNDGYYPGLDLSGNVIPDGVLTGHSGDGTVPAAAMWIMLDSHFFAPEYMMSPAHASAVELVIPPSGIVPPVSRENFSYALQSLAGHPDERGEWSETLNANAVVMGDRAIGTGPADISSDWTAPGSGDWRGTITHNDNSSRFATHPVIANSQYGEQPANPTDHLFEDDPTTADAFLVHDDATTAYSKN